MDGYLVPVPEVSAVSSLLYILNWHVHWPYLDYILYRDSQQKLLNCIIQ